jgi:hypothetical protein
MDKVEGIIFQEVPDSIRSGPDQAQEEARGYSAVGFQALTLDPCPPC